MAKYKISDLIKSEQDRVDIGFGTKITGKDTRIINKDGKFNVKLQNQALHAWMNLYNRLIVMPWLHFGVLILAVFIVTNFLFAILYNWIGTEHLAGIVGDTAIDKFWESFFFSAQTLTTVGYGRISPVGFWASFLAAIESLVGLLSFALATGLLYGKFSRPVAHILYSQKALIAPYLHTTAFMFRIVNERSHQLIDVSADVLFSIIEKNADGHDIRKYYGLALERSKVNFFPTNWTVVHPITEDSPIFGKTKAELKDGQAEFIILIKGFDDAFAQSVHSRSSYTYSEIEWDAKFVPMQENIGHLTYVDIDKLSHFQKVNT